MPPTGKPTDLTDLDTFKDYAGVTNTTSDTLLTRMISAASMFMLQDMNRDNGMQKQSITDLFDGNGNQVFCPRNIPLLSVSAVTINTQTIAPTTSPYAPGFMCDTTNDRIILVGYEFCRGLMNCSVTYQFGYDEIPDDVEQACCELVLLKWKRRNHIDQTSQIIGQGGGSVFFVQKDVPDEVRNTIEQYTVRF